MTYRKYNFAILGIITTLILSACATTGAREPSSINDEEENTRGVINRPEHQHGREPAAMKGNFQWLDQVEEDFGRIASETSHRTVASEQSKETYIKQKAWNLSFSEKTNSFYVNFGEQNYKLVQTSIGDGESYAFAAEGQTENPVTLSVIHKMGRNVASGGDCQAELSYWSAQKHAYVKEQTELQGAGCARLVQKLKDYVP